MRKPEFVQNEEFKVTLWRKEDSLIQNLEKTADQDGTKLGLSWEQVGTKLGLSWDQVRIILKICHTSKSIVEIMEVMGVTNRTKFRKKYIIPLIDEELLAMSFPNKPNSSLQKYYITEKGKLLYKAENNLLEER